MEALLIYLLRSALVLTALLLPFLLLLQKEKNIRLNRLLLLSTLLTSLCLPLVNHSLPQGWRLQLTHETEVAERITAVQTDAMEPISVMEFIEEESNWLADHWMELMILVWALGLIWQLTRLSIGLKTIYSIMHQKGIETIHLEHGVTLYLTAESISSFSWMNSIVMSADDYAENGETILVHEQAHIAARHSLDKLLLLGVQAIQWWNPFVWILGDSLYQVHEYEADQAVIQSGIHATQYQLLLISKAAGPAGLVMVNGFKFNNLKNRIIMMNKKDQTRIAWARYLALAPMLLVAFAVSANSNRPLPEDPQPQEGKQTEERQLEEHNISRPDKAHPMICINKAGEILFCPVVDIKQAEVAYDAAGLDKILDQHKLNPDQAIYLRADRDAQVGDVNAVKEVLRKHNLCKINNILWTEDPALPKFDKQASFPGGDEAMWQFISQNIKNPTDKKCRVHLEFVVEEDGSITDIKCLRSPHQTFTDEAIRIVGMMSKWEPASRQGKALRSNRYLQVVFN